MHMSSEAISSSSTLNIDIRLAHHVIECVVNLTGVRANQDQLLRLGCARILSRFAGSDCSIETKKLCIRAFSNLAEDHASRMKLVDHGQSVVPPLLNLAEEGDKQVKQLCSVALGFLAIDDGCAAKIIQDKYVPIVSSTQSSLSTQEISVSFGASLFEWNQR